MEKLLGMVFSQYTLAEDGQAGLDAFKENNHSIVIADLNMPRMNGIEMIQEIKKINPFVKIIIATAQTDEENMLHAIDAGVFRYLKKPLKLEILVDTLYDIVQSFEAEEHHILFQRQLKDIFNYQNQLIMMMHHNRPILANQSFLKAVGALTLESYLENTSHLDDLLLKEEGFLHTNSECSWFDHLLQHPGKLFHARIMTAANQKRHMIVKLSEIPDKEAYAIVTFDDVTDLNLLALFNGSEQTEGELEEDFGSAQKLMQVVFENQAEVKLYNFYKGLAIINPGTILSVDEDTVVIKTGYTQLKIIDMNKRMTIHSELFPADMVTKAIVGIDYDKQTVTLRNMHFMNETASQRGHQRLEPHINDSISLFYHESKFFGKIRLVDISLVAVRVELNALPAGMKKDEKVKVSLVLEKGNQPLTLTIEATVYKLHEWDYKYYAVFMFEQTDMIEDKLSGYLHQRQLELIKEFKKL